MSEKDECRRWTIAIAQLRNHAARARRGPLPAAIAELLEQSLTLCDAMVRELAGAGLKLDEYRGRLETQTALWSHLFDEMPSACVETDASGIIVNANRAAAVLLNTSVKHLTARLLMHFTEDREQFGQLLRGLSSDGLRQHCDLTVRPRERAPVPVATTVVLRGGDDNSWLWFFTPSAPARTPSREDRTVRQTVASASA